MTVREIINLARYSELEQLNLKSNDEVLLGYFNLGMLELYKRFPIKVEEHLITLVSGQDIYTMPTNFMYIIAAYGEVDESSAEMVSVLAVNEEDNPLSVNTVSWNKLQVPVSVDGEMISIIYVASPEMVGISGMDVAVDLPPQMVEALLNFIGYRAHASVTVSDNDNNIYYNRFEASCQRLDTLGLFTRDDMFMNGRITTKGFV